MCASSDKALVRREDEEKTIKTSREILINSFIFMCSGKIQYNQETNVLFCHMDTDMLFTCNYRQRLAKGKGDVAKENAFTCPTFFDRNYSCRVRLSVCKIKKMVLYIFLSKKSSHQPTVPAVVHVSLQLSSMVIICQNEVLSQTLFV